MSRASPGPVPRVSVVVATHNRARQLGELLDGLSAQTLGPDRFEVVVVDDGSTDGTDPVLAAAAAEGRVRLRVVTRAVPGGPATARDEGWRAAAAPLIAFTDDDCVPEPGWLEAGIAASRGDDSVLVQGRTEPPDGEFEGLGRFEQPFTRTIRVRELDPAFQTCNVFYSRSLLERVGGFDAAAFGRAPGGEDSDLAWRAIEAGARPVFCDDAVVRHAVNRLGPIGKLRVAARWTTALQVYARHPELRRAHFTHRFFWKHSHYLFVRALLAAALPRRLRFLAPWLVVPYLRQLLARGRVEGGGPLLAPFWVLHDAVELVTVIRAAIRYRTPML